MCGVWCVVCGVWCVVWCDSTDFLSWILPRCERDREAGGFAIVLNLKLYCAVRLCINWPLQVVKEIAVFGHQIHTM